MPSSISSSTVLYTVAALAAAKITWDNTPSWIKDGITGESTSSEHADANDDLANPATVWLKIKEVMTLAHSLSEDVIDDDIPSYQIYCCFMSMIHLMNEIDANEPNWRENYFAKDGLDVDEAELGALQQYLDLAQWAYKESQLEVDKLLRPRGYKLLRFDSATEPGRVGHFIAVDHDKKQVVLAIKGTSTWSDVLTDIVGKAIPHTLEGGKEIRCHEGMYTAAQMLMDDTVHLIEQFFVPAGYKLTICGHSLGAGVSCLLGLFIKQRLPDLDLQVYAFATPACLSYEVSTECNDYITSIVNNNDCVPRLSLMNLRIMNKLLILIKAKLEEKGLSPTSFSSARRYLSDLMKIDSNLLLTTQELTDFLEEEFAKPRSDRFLDMELYVPGKVISMWNHTKEENVVGGKVTNGHAQALKQIFVETNMVSDHSCDCYRKNMSQLMEQMENTI